MVRRLTLLAAASALLLALLPVGAARAQDGAEEDDDEVVEPSYYGDIELIETLRGYGLLDEWIAASPVSPQASLLSASSDGYLTKRRAFLTALDSWAARTEPVRRDLARIDAAQYHVDLVRAARRSRRAMPWSVMIGCEDRIPRRWSGSAARSIRWRPSYSRSHRRARSMARSVAPSDSSETFVNEPKPSW